MSCILLKCYRLCPLLWAEKKLNCRLALLRSPKGKSHYIPPAIPWARLSVTLHVGWIYAKCNWQDALAGLPKGLSALQSHNSIAGGSHGTQLVLRCLWVCLKRIILHDKCIPWMLSSIHWDRNRLPILGHDYDVWFPSCSNSCTYCVCAPLSFYVCLLNNFGSPSQFQP